MARKRMIDPEILDSALSKNWKPEDFTVMVAAISTADDEGRGLVSVLFRNISSMISEKKFRKCLQKLDDSIVIYQKIYFFLPKFLKYQTISHPKPSKFPKPNYQENKDLALNSSTEFPPDFQKNSEKCRKASILSKSKVKEYNLNEVSVKEENVDNSVNNPLPHNDPPLLFKNNSSFTFTDYYPFDFNNDQAIKDSLTKLSSVYCNGTGITPSELTRLLNIITKTKNASRQTCFQLTAETFAEWKSFSPEKKNFKYFSSRIEGKISDALVKVVEERAMKYKDNERNEIENMNRNEVFSHVERLKNKFAMD